MAASISRNVIASDPRTGLVVVIAQDAAGSYTIRLEDFFGARDYGVDRQTLLNLAGNILAVANS